MKIKDTPLDKIIPYARNPRVHGAAVDKVAASIKEFGFRQPIVVDAEGVIVAGHARYEAARRLGLAAAPVHVAEGLTPAQAKAYRLADNRVGQEAEWENELLALEFEDLKGADFDLALTGFEDDELAAFGSERQGLTADDEIPALQEDRPPITQPGDLWLLGAHRLLCGDSTSPDDVARLMAAEKADMVFTDPPYGIDEETDRVFASRTRLAKGGRFQKITGDKTIKTAVEGFRVCESLQIPLLIFWGANHYASELPSSASWIVWDKRVEDHQRDMNSDAELAWVRCPSSSVRVFRHLWKGLIKASEQGMARVHPTQKPVALAEWAFEEYGQREDIVLDLFGGSGSTLIACEKTDRVGRLMEIDPHYCDVILRRWQDYTGQAAVLEGDGRSFAALAEARNAAA